MKFIKDHPDGILISVTVQPRSSRNQIAGVHADTLKIKLTAPPVEGQANKMCVQYLAKRLNISKSAVEIVSGHSSRSKKVLIRCNLKSMNAFREKVKALADGN